MKNTRILHGLSRRAFLSTTSVALLALWQKPAWGQTTVSTSFQSLRGNIGIFLGRGGTIGWMVSPDAVVVIDSQFPGTAQDCLNGVNEKSGNRTVDFLINTHHHGDHTAGNSIFRPKARNIVAHERVPELLKQAASRNPDSKPTLPDTTFARKWRVDLGSEVVSARHYGPAHTSGDITVHFENANVVHLGDLVFNRRNPFIDRPAGALITGWIKVLENIVADHDTDTLFIFGHANQGWEITGRKADLQHQRDYFTALLEYTKSEIKSGKTREAFVDSTPELKGFSNHGPLNSRVLSVAYDELTESR